MARDMTTGSEGKHILIFALPIMGGLVLQQLYNTVDSVVVGQVLGENALSAVGTCGALTMFVVSFATGLCNGAGVVFAQFFGAKRPEDLRRTLSTALLLLTGLGLLISVLGAVFAPQVLGGVLAVPAEILDTAAAYFRIYCVGLVFQFIYNVVAAALRSVGDSQATLWFLLVASVLNIILDVVFVIWLNWGVAGTAIATVLCQGVCAAVSVGYMWKKYEYFRLNKGRFRYDTEKSALILKMGVPTMLQMCVVSGGNVLIQRVTNGLGTAAIAAATAAGRIENYMFIPCQGLNNGIGTFTGQNIGAGQFDRVLSGRVKARRLLLPVAVVMAAALVVFARPLVAIFGVEGQALELGVAHLRFIAPFFILFALYMSTAGVLNGAGDVLASSAITLGCLVVRVAFTYLFCYGLGLGFASLYYANPLGWVFGFVAAWFRFRGGKWKEKALVKRG